MQIHCSFCRLLPSSRIEALIVYEDCDSSLACLVTGWTRNHGFKELTSQVSFSQVIVREGTLLIMFLWELFGTKLVKLGSKVCFQPHPFSGSEKRTELDAGNGEVGEVAMNDMFCKRSPPKGSNRDYSRCNFKKKDFSKDEWDQFPAVVFYVAGSNLLKKGVLCMLNFCLKRGFWREWSWLKLRESRLTIIRL